MGFKGLFVLTLPLVMLFQSASHAQGAGETAIFLAGKQVTATFTGKVWVQPLVLQDSTFNLVAGSVTFSPGARSYWHTHNAGQILLVTAGTGYTQERGKPVRIIRKGEVIVCKPGVEHWHGASAGSAMTHVSLNPNSDRGVVNWLKPVTEDEYR